MPVLPGQTACLECLFDDVPRSRQPTCDTAGVLNAVTSLIASLQVVEALKILAGRLQALERKLVTIDVWSGERAVLQADTPRPWLPDLRPAAVRSLGSSVRRLGADLWPRCRAGARSRPPHRPPCAGA